MGVGGYVVELRTVLASLTYDCSVQQPIDICCCYCCCCTTTTSSHVFGLAELGSIPNHSLGEGTKHATCRQLHLVSIDPALVPGPTLSVVTIVKGVGKQKENKKGLDAKLTN